MRHAAAVVPWVTCALLVLAAPATDAQAQKKPAKKPKKIAVNKCVKYSQAEYESGFYLNLKSNCEPRVTCELRWKIECEDDEVREFAEAFSLDTGDSHRGDAAAAICGDSAWSVSGVKWSCEADESG